MLSIGQFLNVKIETVHAATTFEFCQKPYTLQIILFTNVIDWLVSEMTTTKLYTFRTFLNALNSRWERGNKTIRCNTSLNAVISTCSTWSKQPIFIHSEFQKFEIYKNVYRVLLAPPLLIWKLDSFFSALSPSSLILSNHKQTISMLAHYNNKPKNPIVDSVTSRTVFFETK